MAAPLALYRRYRPATFAEVIGQEQVTGPLQRALAADRVGHAYLFSGPRGCGKTTSARILARSVNCELGPTPTPCGVCRSCVELAPGGPGSVDVVEIDAASHGKVDDTRDLRERAFFAPVAARRKIYIIDEAHMVSKEGFNALLKVVEEPPEYLTFVFATTEPDKVLATIRSRTHHYPFRLIPPRVLSDHLASIAVAEKLAIEPAALALVVRAGGGSARDSLSVLDQLMAGSGPEGVTYDGAVALLGYTPESLLDRVVESLAAEDGADLFAAVGQVVDSGQDPRRFAEDLLRRLRDLVMIGAVPGAGAAGLLEAPAEVVDRLVAQQARFGQAHALRAAEVVDAGLTEIRGATAPRLHLELMLARLLLPAADGSQAAFAARLERIERRLASPLVTQLPAVAERPDPPAVPSSPPPTPSPQPPRILSPVAAPSPVASLPPVAAPAKGSQPAAEELAPQATSAPAPEPAAAAPSAAFPAATSTSAAPLPAAPLPAAPLPVPTSPEVAPGSARVPGSLGLADLRKLWDEVLDHVKGRSRIAYAALLGSQVVGVDAGRITVSFANEGMRANFTRGNRAPFLNEALEALLALHVEIDTVVGAGGAPHASTHAGARTGSPEGFAASRRSTGSRRPPVSSETPPAADPDRGPTAVDSGGWPTTAVLGGPPVDEPEDPGAGSAPSAEGDDISPDDPDFDDPTVSGAELLTRELGAEIIAERPAS